MDGAEEVAGGGKGEDAQWHRRDSSANASDQPLHSLWRSLGKGIGVCICPIAGDGAYLALR
jgi:hypothetical protein